jgi:hypothetical protein
MQSLINFDHYQILKESCQKPLNKSPQTINSACSGYSESTPSALHKDGVMGIEKIQLFNLYSQYPLCLLLFLLLR